MSHDETRFETKVAQDAPFFTASADDLMRAWAEYRETNDRRLADIERRFTADVVTTDKLARLDREIDRQRKGLEELALKQARPPLGGEAGEPENREHRAAFEAYVRRGIDPASLGLEAKALSAGSTNEGSVLVPRETEAAVNRALSDISPIRAIADVRQVSGGTLVKPFATSNFATGWVAETAARPMTGNSTLGSLTFPTMEIYAMPAATQPMLDDAVVDIDSWIAEEVRRAFATQEGVAFVSGDGTSRPKGFLTYPTVAASAWTWGNVGFVTSGAAGAFPATNPSDRLIDLTFALKAGYRENARFVMNRSTLSAIRKFKDTNGNYIWQPPTRAGEASSLLGYPVTECEDMPNVAADALAIAFGDFRRGYLVVDRVGIRVLRDPYSAKPYVLFYTTKRVGGGIQDFDAIKLLKFSV